MGLLQGISGGSSIGTFRRFEVNCLELYIASSMSSRTIRPSSRGSYRSSEQVSQVGSYCLDQFPFSPRNDTTACKGASRFCSRIVWQGDPSDAANCTKRTIISQKRSTLLPTNLLHWDVLQESKHRIFSEPNRLQTPSTVDGSQIFPRQESLITKSHRRWRRNIPWIWTPRPSTRHTVGRERPRTSLKESTGRY